MAYRLKRRRPLAEELARIVAKEFEKALDQISDEGARRAEAIHEARKSIKKIRAVLRMVRKDLGEAPRIKDGQLRAVAHQLSPFRDADVTVEMVASVRNRCAQLITSASFAEVHRRLVAWRRRALAGLDSDRVLGRVRSQLRRSAAATTRLIRRRVSGYDSIRSGMTRGYRRARKAMVCVHRNPEDAGFHTWRRRVKDHWYQVRLLEGLNPAAHARARRLKRLETLLGDDHNLVLLRTTILSTRARFGHDRATVLVLGCIATYQTTLRRRALRLGHRLFSRRPKVFRKSVDHWYGGREPV
jgi:CHAD domain-containing protein